MKLEDATKHAIKHGYELSEHAENILRLVEMNDGHCPCKKEGEPQPCPCVDHHDEISINGRCTCSLFIQR